MTVVKSRVFIGSSRESISYVNAVHGSLSYCAEVTPWTAAFNPTQYTMESLENQLDTNDFAIFIFSPDDVANIRGKYHFITRDNTLFEMGLFWGRLRRGRVFYIIPQSVPAVFNDEQIDSYHLASDLDGITVLHYDIRMDKNYIAAVNIACGKILEQINQLGPFPDPAKALEEANAKSEMEYNLIRFLRKLSRGLLIDSSRKYEDLSDALRNAFAPPTAYTVEGIGVWKAESTDGLRQIAGNDGRNKFYPFNANDSRTEEDKICVVDCYLESEERVYFKNDSHFDKTYVMCYPIDNKLVLTVAITGRKELRDKDIDQIFLANYDLMQAIHYLFRGEINES